MNKYDRQEEDDDDDEAKQRFSSDTQRDNNETVTVIFSRYALEEGRQTGDHMFISLVCEIHSFSLSLSIHLNATLDCEAPDNDRLILHFVREIKDIRLEVYLKDQQSHISKG